MGTLTHVLVCHLVLDRAGVTGGLRGPGRDAGIKCPLSIAHQLESSPRLSGPLEISTLKTYCMVLLES